MRRLAVVVFAVFNFGCASKLYLPTTRFITPEAGGEFLSGDFKVGSASVVHVQVADDITLASPDTTPDVKENSTVALGVDLGLLPFVNAYYTGVQGAPGVGGIKIQLLGDGSSSAKKNNFSLAIAGGANFGSVEDEAESGGVTGNSDIDFGGWEAMALMGYRPADKVLIYLGAFRSFTTADVKITRTSGGTTTTTAQPDGEAEVEGGVVGLRLGKDFFLGVEGSYSETNYKLSLIHI